jgi:hypothetical protein
MIVPGAPAEVDPARLAPLLALAALSLAIGVLVCRQLVAHLKLLPASLVWGLKPWSPWLLLVPGANLFMNFHVLLGVSRGYTAAFAALGRELPVRESGRNEALVVAVGACLGLYPAPPMILGAVWASVLLALTLYLFKLHSLRDRYLRIEKD